MSLVNDMLKDLDQRRSGTGGGSRVELTPASEFSRATKKNWPFALVGLLIIVVGGLGYTWLQLNNESPRGSETPNNIPSGVSPFEMASSSSAPISADSADSAEENSLIDDPVVPTTPQPERLESNSVRAPVQINPVTNSPMDILSQAVQRRGDSSQQIEFYRPEIVDDTNVAAEEPFADPIDGEGIVDIRSGEGLDESVKDEAEISADQRDAMAVQQSLRLLADSKTVEAYANFASYIVENKYAHQSRETYAKLLLNSGELEIANKLIAEGLDLAPNHTGFKKVKARLLIQEGHLLDAVALLVAKAPEVSEDIEYHEILASAQLATKDYAGAAISYSELVGADQTRGKFWYGYAASQELLGNVNVARQAYARAVQQPSLSTNLRRRSQDRLLALRE